MFNKDFYPTPYKIVHKMIDGLSLYNSTVLEPSAGKGNICAILAEKGSHVDCIESEQELRKHLTDYNIVGYDFLSFVPQKKYNYVIMNPPFSNGADHLLHAIDLFPFSEIRCLLNSETIENISNNKKKVLYTLIEKHGGTIENLGQCFKGSERTTNVSVSLVIIPAREIGSERISFEEKTKERKYTINDFEDNKIAKPDIFECMVDAYNSAKRVYTEIREKMSELQKYKNVFCTEDIEYIFTEKTFFNEKEFENTLRNYAWKTIFEKTKIAGIVTEKVKKDFNSFMEDSQKMGYTKENIISVFEKLFESKDEIFNSCILEAFDYLTKYHKENRCHVEGWKTNDYWKVNRKFILPYIVEPFDVKFNRRMNISWRSMEKICDLEKALCFIIGKKWDDIKSIDKVMQSLYSSDSSEFGVWYDSEFFSWEVFKKGTGHFKFKDTFVYEKFNQIACKNKNWLPESL